MSNKKIVLGQFNTISNSWLKPQVLDFIINSKAEVAIDPFAGDGHLLNLATDLGIKKILGFDIDRSKNWKINDSLLNIPVIKKSIVITNPPYLTNYSAKRKGINIWNKVKRYYEGNQHTDLYQVALERCLLSSDLVVAIIPETFINSGFPISRLKSLTVLEDNPFIDTETPVCVVCFDKTPRTPDKVDIFINEKKVGSWADLHRSRLMPRRIIKLKFNDSRGNIALRAVDLPSPNKCIKFLNIKDLDYDLSGIKHSSRLITLIAAEVPNELLTKVILKSNDILGGYRKGIGELTLSPFKGNNKLGKRRRRLDYATARAILEKAHLQVLGEKKQSLLF